MKILPKFHFMSVSSQILKFCMLFIKQCYLKLVSVLEMTEFGMLPTSFALLGDIQPVWKERFDLDLLLVLGKNHQRAVHPGKNLHLYYLQRFA